MLKRSLYLLVGVTLGLVATVLALRATRPDQIGAYLAQVDAGWLGVSIAGAIVVALSKAGRWQAMFSRRDGRPSYAALFSAMIIGQTTNVLLPLRLGEVARTLTLKRQAGVPVALGMGTVVAEKLADLSFFGFGVLALPWLAGIPAWLRDSAVAVLTIGAFAAIAAGVMVARPEWRMSVAGLAPGRLRVWLSAPLEHFLEGWSVLWRPGMRGRVWRWTLGIWLLSAITPAALAQAIGRPLLPGTLLMLLIALQVSFVLPTPPGLLGVVQYICVLILPFNGADPTAAFAYGLLLNGVLVIPLVMCGVMAWLYVVGRSPARAPTVSS